MNTLRTLIIAVACCASVSAVANEPDSVSGALTDRVLLHALQPLQTRTAIFAANPGAMPTLQTYALSHAEVAARHSDGFAPMPEHGTGFMAYDITAASYMPVGKHGTAWGHAGFESRKRRQVRWCEAADYDLISPYVLGDSVGGDIQRRQYTFGGGYGAIAGAFSWGAQADYRAQVDYRDRDPRIRATVSDLRLAVGGTYAISGRYRVGVGGGMRVYNQDCDLDFYSPVVSTYLYALTGLGTYYPRFSGTADRQMAYSGLGANATVQLLTTTANGLNLTANYAHQEIRQTLRDYNNLELTHLSLHSVGVKAQYIYGIVAPEVSAHWRRKIGTENIFGTSLSNSYEKIGSRNPYFDDYVWAQVSVPVTLHSGAWHYGATPKAGYAYSRQFYVSPRRDVVIDGWAPGLQLHCSWQSGTHWAASIKAEGAWQGMRATRQTLTALDTNTALGQMTLDKIDAQKADQTYLHAQGTVYYAISRAIVMSLSGQYAQRHWQGLGTRRDWAVSLAAHF